MADKDNIQTPNVEKLIPQQLVGDSQALIEFLKEYYRFLNQENEPVDVVNKIVRNKDLDDAVDAYIEMVRKELGYGMARQLEANKINLYKHIGEFYRSKGSIDSFKLLFRLLFNKNVEISLPKEQILVASDGKWIQQTSLFTEVSAGTAFDLVNTFVDIVNIDGSTVRVEVERVRHYKENVYEIVVSRFFVGTINNNATFSSNGVSGTVINSLSGFTIDYPGKKFKVGQLLDVVYGTSIGTKIKVTSTNADGGITGLEFLSFGVDYPEEFTSQVVPVGFDYFFTFDPDTDTYNGSLNDQVGSSEYIYLEINPYCFGFDELQADGTQYAASDYFSETYTEGLEFVRVTDDKYFAEAYLDGQRAIGSLTQAAEDTSDVSQTHIKDTDPAALVTLQSLYPNRAIITFRNTPLSRYAGSYSTNKGFLSDDIYLQDNFYYQQFSYVIKTDEQFSTYEGIVKQTVHPSGMQMFGEFEITNEIDASSVIALLATLYRTDFSDAIRTSESIFDKTLIKSPEPELDTIITSQFVYYEFTKPLTEELITSQTVDYFLTKPEVDEIFSTEAIQDFHVTKPLIDEVVIEDSSLFEDPALAYAFDYFRQDYSEGLVYDTTNGFSWELIKPFVEEMITSQTVDYEFTKSEVDTIITSQTVDYFLTKPLTDELITSQSVEVLNSKSLSHTISTSQQVDYELVKPFYETLNVSNADAYSPELTKPFTETMTTADELLPFYVEKNILDDVAATEDRFFTDPENPNIYVEAENDPDSDLAIGYFAGSYVEDINVPLLEKAITKPLEDSINNITDGGFVFLNPYTVVDYYDLYFAEEYIEGSRAIS